MKYNDIFGHPIEVNDYIIYSVLDGRCAVMRFGQVLELTESKEIDYYTKSKSPKIKVKSIRLAWGGTFSRQKDVFLSFFDRLMVIHKEQLDKEVINLFET